MQQSPQLLGGATITQKQSWKERVQQHLKEKWDIELTIFLSIAAGVLNLFGIVDSKVTIDFILIIFSLIAVSILRNRWANEDIGKTIKDVEEHMPAIRIVADHLPNIRVVAERLPGIEETINNVGQHMPTIDMVADHLPNIRVVAERLPIITEVLVNLTMYARQDEAEASLLSYIRDNEMKGKKIKEAVILRYSINPALVARLLESGAKVTVFMQDEASAKLVGSQQQAAYISNAYSELKGLLPKPLEDYPLTVYKFQPPSSMVGMKLDDQLIYMGWYTYEYTNDSNRFRVSHNDDTTQLYGHDKAALIALKGYYGFNMLETTFRSLVGNYEHDATCILPASQRAQEKNESSPIKLIS